MSKNFSQTKFEQARKKLANALKNLDETLKEKLQEASNQTKFLSASKDNFGDLQHRLIQQSNAILNLNSEINRLQQSLAAVDKELDFNKEKNAALSQRFNEFRNKQKKSIEAIESDLSKLESKIDREENNG